MRRPQQRTERGHFTARILERNRQAQLTDELGAHDQLGIFVRTKEPADPHKKTRVRPLVHFPLELKLPGPIALPSIPQDGRGRPSALTNARARLILAVTCTGATIDVIAAVGGVTPSTLRSWLTRRDHEAYRTFQRAFAEAETYATLAALKAMLGCAEERIIVKNPKTEQVIICDRQGARLPAESCAQPLLNDGWIRLR